MKFHKQKISGVYLIEPEPFIDIRGMYRRHFCQNEFKSHGIAINVAQANIVENNKAFTLRGFHYQKPPHGEGKTLSCIKGSIYDIVVDLDPSSPTYLQWISFELNDKNRNSIYIPPTCAHAVLTLEDSTIVHYYTSEFYHPESGSGFRYNDPTFDFKWPHTPQIISEKDKSFPDFVPQK